MALELAEHTNLLPLIQRDAGAYNTGPISNPGQTNNLIVMVFVTAGSGTTHTLDVAIQTSADAATWTTVASGAQITGTTGSQLIHAHVGTALYAQVLATVAGTGTPTKTFTVGALVL